MRSHPWSTSAAISPRTASTVVSGVGGSGSPMSVHMTGADSANGCRRAWPGGAAIARKVDLR